MAAVCEFTLTRSHRPTFVCFVSVISSWFAPKGLICRLRLMFSICSAIKRCGLLTAAMPSLSVLEGIRLAVEGRGRRHGACYAKCSFGVTDVFSRPSAAAKVHRSRCPNSLRKFFSVSKSAPAPQPRPSAPLSSGSRFPFSCAPPTADLQSGWWSPDNGANSAAIMP